MLWTKQATSVSRSTFHVKIIVPVASLYILADIIVVQLLGHLTVQHNMYSISFYDVHSNPHSVQ